MAVIAAAKMLTIVNYFLLSVFLNIDLLKVAIFLSLFVFILPDLFFIYQLFDVALSKKYFLIKIVISSEFYLKKLKMSRSIPMCKKPASYKLRSTKTKHACVD